MDKELMKGSIDILLLSLIAERDMYGYEITKELKEKSDNLYHMSEGTLYPALNRLHKKGWVTSYWGDNEAQGRRKYYQITDAGAEELQRKVSDWNTIHSLVSKVANGFV
ncbi:PadR family transcriptional regulator [Brevibacillus laterosporus]|uniref:Lineage-specific thermal regulator protein n=1 Tax=Brevibacillus laterosporus LMG 15441 TaxID=1042163 RepID=A0A075R558_BRELA|nr:PadR family transcriptional regulator [Brevibacillus laterosporus]AIG27687.1 lineage-specific thermal regulator protein [Brevibacillus laterosporus LMG 15441]RJL15581.1 PadR family transcriptional regulator [Brevibacillus laterosporus]TPH06255.1 PadR family transcriptional regulator [Brevibacillus laterosporus]HAS01685.1 PadR family transcriptional regulator [Brevibacillus sp.]